MRLFHVSEESDIKKFEPRLQITCGTLPMPSRLQRLIGLYAEWVMPYLELFDKKYCKYQKQHL